MKKRLENNLALKIIAILFAVGLWLFVNNVDDPVITARYSVKVTVQNENYIYDDGKTYQIEEDARTVTVLVRGRESVVQNRTDLSVVANLTEIQDKDATSTYVPVTFQEVSGITLEDVEIFPKVIPIRIENSDQKEFVVDVRIGDGEPGDGYEIGETISDPEMVTIQGPESIIEKISTVIAYVQLNGETSDTEISTRLEVIDRNGDALTDDLEYLNFDIGNERMVNVSVKLWKVREGVRLETDYSGQPASGYTVSKVTITPESISVAGSDEALEALEENGNVIQIPSDLVNIDGLSKDYQTRIELSSLLSKDEGLMPTEENQTVQVQVSILPEDSQEFEVPTESVQIGNLGEGLHVTFIRKALVVRVKGSENASLDNLSADDIQLSINLEDLGAGSYTCPVSVTLPEGYQQVEDVKADIQVTNIESTSE